MSEKYSGRNRVVVQVDRDICVGFGDCVAVAPEVFRLDEDNLAVVMDPDAVDLKTLEGAAGVCPVSAILLLDASGARVAPEA
jgi:ferredoxin